MMNRGTLLLGVVGLLLGLCAQADAATLHVANNAVDSGTCGTEIDPCRSISQAITNASAGDTIVIGPGHYGDLNRNGTFGEAGEEKAEVGFGCQCMVKVDKPLTLKSRDGADATVLDASGAAISVVQIEASDVVFGTLGHGFTLTGGAKNVCFFGGVLIAASTNGVQVAGNQAIANGCFGFLVTGGTGHVLRGNLASANFLHGFFLAGGDRVTLQGNRSVANGGHGVRGDGFVVFGSRHTLIGNAALGNTAGFGISVTGGADHTISKNNIYGNNIENITGAGPNCGLVNLVSEGTLNATHNFWGASSGPGPDPADNVCDFGGARTTFAPFAVKEFKVGFFAHLFDLLEERD